MKAGRRLAAETAAVQRRPQSAAWRRYARSALIYSALFNAIGSRFRMLYWSREVCSPFCLVGLNASP